MQAQTAQKLHDAAKRAEVRTEVKKDLAKDDGKVEIKVVNKAVADKLSEMWGAITDEDKKPFVDQADKLQAEYVERTACSRDAPPPMPRSLQHLVLRGGLARTHPALACPPASQGLPRCVFFYTHALPPSDTQHPPPTRLVFRAN